MEAKQARSTSTPPVLRHGDGRDVMVIPKTNDWFFLSGSDAAGACLSHAQSQAFARMMQEKWQALVHKVQTWCRLHTEVSKAVFTRRDDFHFLLVLVVAGETHNFDLDDAVSELDLAVRREFEEIPCSILTTPSGGGDMAFIDDREALEIYATTGKSQGGR